jgi:tRNA pseudouridine55 synthase
MSAVYLVHKPRGLTSHDVVMRARRALKTPHIGHTGTLDPFATGLLLLCVDEATKLVPYLTGQDKTYRATIVFGIATDTQDSEGTVTAHASVSELPDLAPFLDAERERTLQVPPIYSALHVEGVRAHKLARRGDAPVLPPREVIVRNMCAAQPEFATLERVLPEDSALHLQNAPKDLAVATVVVELAVASGYYVRSFARDLGERLGLPATCLALERTRVGQFHLGDACALEGLTEHDIEPPNAKLDLVTAARSCLPAYTLTEEGSDKARMGKKLASNDFASCSGGTTRGDVAVGDASVGDMAFDRVPPDGPALWFSPERTMLAIGARDDRYDSAPAEALVEMTPRFRVLRGFQAAQRKPV